MASFLITDTGALTFLLGSTSPSSDARTGNDFRQSRRMNHIVRSLVDVGCCNISGIVHGMGKLFEGRLTISFDNASPDVLRVLIRRGRGRLLIIRLAAFFCSNTIALLNPGDGKGRHDATKDI